METLYTASNRVFTNLKEAQQFCSERNIDSATILTNATGEWYPAQHHLQEAIQAVAKEISEMMLAAGIDKYTQADEFDSITDVDADLLFEICLDNWTDTYGELPVWYVETVIEELDADIQHKVFIEVRDIIHDRDLYNRNPLAYYGMSQKDFL